ncbi:MAG: hypothetical protein ACFFCX_10705 [Candidatus Sifarchaeia archaeon]
MIIDFVWSLMMHLGYLPAIGGLSGPLIILYIIFQPITFSYSFIIGVRVMFR